MRLFPADTMITARGEQRCFNVFKRRSARAGAAKPRGKS